MARYTVHVASPRSPEDSFAYMSDLANFAEWDPGVRSSTLVTGDRPADGAAYDVVVNGIAGPLTLRYVLGDFRAPESFVAIAESNLLKSVDTIVVRPHEAGSLVTYDAVLTLKGLLGLADPILRLAFTRIGGKAAEGLTAALEGTRVESPES